MLQRVRNALTAHPAAGVALAALAVQLATLPLYGPHRDELYLAACARHLDWGSVDHAPLTPAIAWLFGGYARIAVAAIGAITIVLAGEIARLLGGGRAAQVLAAASIAISPAFFYTRGVVTTNAVDQLVWSAAIYCVLRRRWLLLGVVLGLGLENKYSVLVLGAALAVAFAATARRELATRGPYVAAAIAIALWLPNLAWQHAHDWPVVEFLRDHHAARIEEYPLVRFVAEQPFTVHPFVFALAMIGLVAAVRARHFIAWWFGATLLVFAVQHGKPYYLAPAYPPLVAYGAVVLARKARPWGWIAAAWLVGGVIGAIATLPLMPARISHELALDRMNNQLVQFADWSGLAAQVARAAGGDPVVTDSYGTAAALEQYEPGVAVTSGANSYALWAPPSLPAAALVIGYDPALLYRDCSPAGDLRGPFDLGNRFDFPRTMYRCRGVRAGATLPLRRD